MSSLPFSSDEQSKKYIKARRETPDKVLEHIISYYSQQSNSFECALDVGCGSGQSTFKLAKYFENVIGVDINETQIKQVPIHQQSNIKFLVADAQTLEWCDDQSVDMVTVAATLHWIPYKDVFYKEVKRVLKTNGVLAVYSYSFPDHNNPKSSDYVKEWFNENIVKPDYTPLGFGHSMNCYADITLPFRETKRIDMMVDTTWSVNQFVQFIESTSFVECLLKNNQTSTAVSDLKEGLTNIYGKNSKSEDMELAWPYFLLLGRK